MCSCHSILECCVMFSGVKLSMGSFVLLLGQGVGQNTIDGHGLRHLNLCNFGAILHLFDANWSILKFALDNRKILIIVFLVTFLNRRDQISLTSRSSLEKPLRFARERRESWKLHMRRHESSVLKICFKFSS